MGLNFGTERVWGSPELICVVDKINIFLQCYWLGSPWHIPEAGPVLPQNSVIWGGSLDICFSRCKTHWDNFCLDSCLFLQSRLFPTCVFMVLLLYSSKKTLSFSFKVTMFLHFLWTDLLALSRTFKEHGDVFKCVTMHCVRVFPPSFWAMIWFSF